MDVWNMLGQLDNGNFSKDKTIEAVQSKKGECKSM